MCNDRKEEGGGKRTGPFSAAQQQTVLTCVTAAKATVKQKGSSRDPAIASPLSFTSQGLSASC